MKLYEVNGTYGASKTPCTVFVARTGRRSWYVVEGSQNVNYTDGWLFDNVDVELLEDIDCFTASSPICSLEDLELAIES